MRSVAPSPNARGNAEFFLRKHDLVYFCPIGVFKEGASDEVGRSGPAILVHLGDGQPDLGRLGTGGPSERGPREAGTPSA